MVEFGDSLELELDKEFDVFLNMLDFPMDCMEGEDGDADNWDIGYEECLGPIPYNVLMELPMISIEEFDSDPTAGAPEESKSATVQESGSFHTQSPASVLESSGSCSREKSFSIESDKATPTQNRLKPAKYSDKYLELSTSKQASNATRSKESGNTLPIAIDLMNSPEKGDDLFNVSDIAHKVTSKARLPLVKKCANCQSSETSKWRKGPLGPKTLCNACGVRYRYGRLFPEYRPLASSTFSPSQHSNFLTRDKSKRLKVDIQIDGAPEQKQQHVDDTSSHVLPLESSRSYLQYGSKYSNHVSAKPKIPPSQPCEKTSGEENSFVIHLEDDDESLEDSDCVVLWSSSNPCPPLVKKSKRKKKCAHCQSTKSPAWTEGLLGPHTLSNACGVRYRAGHPVPAYRPESSPSFVQSQHLAKHTDTSSSLIHPQIGITPEHKQTEQMQVDDTSSHVSLLESSGSYSIYRPKYVKHAGAEAWVPPSTPCENTSCEEKLFEVPIANCDEYFYGAIQQNPSNPCATVLKKCTHLESRKGPLGPCTLCNAHGQKHQAGHLVPEFRPYASPTFLPSQHSKSLGEPMPSTADIKIVKKHCAHCQGTETPYWRKGPLGPKTLCNACGKQYLEGRLVPEYRPHQHPNSRPKLVKMMMQSTANVEVPQHSNSHRKVVEMRSKAKLMNVEMKVAPTSPTKEAKIEEPTIAPHMEAKISETPCSQMKTKKKMCASCGSTETPQWRAGPGQLRLCNACGLFYRSMLR